MNYNFNIIKDRTWSKGMPSNLEMPQPVHKSVLGSTSHQPLCCSSTVDSIPCGQHCGGLLKHFFLDPTRPGRPRLCAGDTCHWNMCHHTMHSINGGHQSFAQKVNLPLEQQIANISQTKYGRIPAKSKGAQQDPHFQISSNITVSPFQISILGPHWVRYTNETHVKVWKGLYQQDPLSKQHQAW